MLPKMKGTDSKKKEEKKTVRWVLKETLSQRR
jgi:hypothetical protein